MIIVMVSGMNGIDIISRNLCEKSNDFHLALADFEVGATGARPPTPGI